MSNVFVIKNLKQIELSKTKTWQKTHASFGRGLVPIYKVLVLNQK